MVTPKRWLTISCTVSTETARTRAKGVRAICASSIEIADAVAAALHEQLDDRVAEIDPLGARLGAQNGPAHLARRRMDVRDQAALEAAAQLLLEAGNVGRRLVGGQHDLL